MKPVWLGQYVAMIALDEAAYISGVVKRIFTYAYSSVLLKHNGTTHGNFGGLGEVRLARIVFPSEHPPYSCPKSSERTEAKYAWGDFLSRPTHSITLQANWQTGGPR